jgi:histidyl-tRNA synthetase
VIQRAEELGQRYGFQRIDPPLFEDSQIFLKGSGHASDFVIQKEMYTLEKEEGQSITFRPEFTPGVVRAYLEHGMHAGPQPVKLYSIGPIFRHDRPQAGRYRQHSQFNAEIIGAADPVADLEVMLLALDLYTSLGYRELTFQLNSTGCPNCRPAYVSRLVKYIAAFEDRLGETDLVGLGLLHQDSIRGLGGRDRGSGSHLWRWTI